jgi:xylulokinase
VFSGLSSSSDIGDLIRAAMEGVAFNVRQCLEIYERAGMEVREIRVAEGGSRLDLWCQILAGCLGRPVTRVKALNTSSLGAALIAQAGTPARLRELCRRLVERGETFAPLAESAPQLEDAFQRYLAAARWAAGDDGRKPEKK